jgi:type IV pilus assembly protein PilO
VLILLLILVVANIGVYFFSSLYQEPRLSQLQNRWSEIQRTSRTPAIDRGTAYQLGSADLKAWKDRIAPKRDLARIVGELFAIASSNSVTVGGITYKPEKVKEDDTLLAYGIGLTVTGRYAAVKSFVADLGRLKEIVVVDSVSLNNSKMTEEQVDLKVSLTAYLRLEG